MFLLRTDNSIKNHYYSTLRKGFRRLNHYILSANLKGLVKPMSPVQLSKAVLAAEDKFERKLPVSDSIRTLSCDILDKFILLSR